MATWFRKVVIGAFGVGLVAVAVVLGIAVFRIWEVVETVAARAGATGRDPIELELLSGYRVDLTEGQSYLALVLVFGMVGSFIHAATSFTTYVGNRKFQLRWAWWYLLRPFIGGAVALILAMAVLGGLVTVTSNGDSIDPRNFNPYSVAALAGLAGWFSKIAADKLEQVFETILQNAKDEERADKLDGPPPPTITGLAPGAVVVGAGSVGLTVIGTGFAAGARVRVGDGPAVGAVLVDGTALSVEITAPPSPGPVEVVVVNPDGETSEAVELVVTAAAGPSQPAEPPDPAPRPEPAPDTEPDERSG